VTASQRAARTALVAEVALAFLAGLVAFWATGSAVSGLDSDAVAALLGVAYLAVVTAVARRLGVAYAVPVAMAGMLAYDWFYLPPTHALEVPDTANLVDLLVYLGVGVLIGQLGADAVRRAKRSERARAAIAADQAALRRVATLVARGVAPDDVFAAVAREVAQLLGVHATHIARYDTGGTATGVGSWSPAGTHVRVGTHATLDDTSVMGLVRKSGRSARIEDYEGASGEVAAMTQALDVRSSVGAPIVVDGRLWGVVVASSDRPEPLPVETESRLMEFTELVATAISNTEARAEVHRLADEQAALRRVATLVARGAPAADVFTAVAEEVGQLLHIADTALLRYEPDGGAVVMVNRVEGAIRTPVGTRVALEGGNVATQVLQTGRSVRQDDYDADTADALGSYVNSLGFNSGIGTPIVVEGRLWGVMIAVARQADSLPAGAEGRMEEFTELIGTAIANIQARSDLADSRARIVAAADEERRRVVRDLHDGAQQRLVHTVVTLKLAQRARGNDEPSRDALVTEALGEAEQAMSELRELAHGILPSILTRGGLRAGLEALASRIPIPVDVSVTDERLPAAVEATAYFVVAEALTNVAKHSHAARAGVVVEVDSGSLRVLVRDDGVGGAQPYGNGLVGLADRLAVLNGRLRIESPDDGGTLVAAVIPLSDQLAGFRR
jgi:signal transduction histidine kinase